MVAVAESNTFSSNVRKFSISVNGPESEDTGIVNPVNTNKPEVKTWSSAGRLCSLASAS